MYCIVRGCRSVGSPNCGVKFHRFPSNPHRRQAWLSAILIKGTFYSSARICSLHFKPEDYDPGKPGLLLSTAVPFYSPQPCICCNALECENQPSTSQKIPVCAVRDDKPSQTQKTSKSDLNDQKECGNPQEIEPSCTKSTDVLLFSALVNPLKDNRDENEPPLEKDKITPSSPLSQYIIGKKEVEKNTGKILKVSTIENIQSVAPQHYELPQDFSVQVNLKTNREEKLLKEKKVLRQRVERQEKTIKNMKELVNIVRSYTSQSEIENILQGNFANICEKFNRKKKKKVVKYSDDVKSFALTIHFYSPKAYSHLRSRISLPHQTTLWRSISTFNCNVGFLTEVLEFLKIEVKTKTHLKNVAIIFDSMSLKEDLAYCPKLGKVFGYVDLGSIPVNDPEELASEVLVFQIVSYTNYFKCPIGYFYTRNSLSGELLGQLVKTCITLLFEAGIIVRSLTCDGAKSNIKAYESLGCNLLPSDIRPYFKHPNTETKVYCFLDPAHMLKLTRNVLAEKGLQTETDAISFKYIEELHKVQEEKGLKLSNKVTGTHINFHNKKMNVRLAAQVLSSSVADAIDFLRQSGNPRFFGSEATVEFLRIIDRLFDIMNSRSPFGKHFNSPLSNNNSAIWQGFFDNAELYLKKLKIGEQSILQHIRKTFALGFIMNIKSFKFLFEDLSNLEENPIKYLLTFKCSQDNLEIFFSCIRARGRTQDNPSPLEFRYILRKLLFRNSVKPSINANCVDNTFHTNHIMDFNTTLNFARNNNSNTDNDDSDFVQLILQLESPESTPYQDNVLYYITGFIVFKILQKNDCRFCHDILTTDAHKSDHTYSLNINKFSTFTSFVNRGKLCFASDACFEVVKYVNSIFKQTVAMGYLKVNNITSKLVLATLHRFQDHLQDMFTPKHPATESIICLDSHETEIVKFITIKFLQIRMSSYLKTHVQKQLGDIRLKRQKLHKTILFSHV